MCPVLILLLVVDHGRQGCAYRGGVFWGAENLLKMGMSGVSYLKAGHSIPSQADLGRFISRDPIGFRGGLNLFNGAGTSPVTYVDPSGLLETDENGAVKAEYVSSGVQTFGKEHPFEANVAQVRLRTNDGQYLIDAMILTDFDPEVQRAQTDCHGSTFTAGRFWIDNSQIEKLLMGDGYTPLTRDETPQLSDVAIYLKDGKIYHSAFVTQPGKDPMVWEKSGTREQCGFRRSTQSEGGSKPIFFRLRLPGTAPWLGFNPANEILNKVKRYLAI